MIDVIFLGIAVWLITRDQEPSEKPDPVEEPVLPDPGGIPVPGDDREYPDTIEECWASEDGLEKVWKIGVHRAGAYDYSYVIGNESGTAFMSANSDRGTTTITATDGSRVKRVVVYSTKQKAIDRIEREEPSRPGDPRKRPPEDEEEDDTPSRPSLPTRPDYGFGGLVIGGGMNGGY